MDIEKEVLQNVVNPDEEHEQASKIFRCCKCSRYDGICFRTSLIALAVIFYLLIGGATFLALEGPTEAAQNEMIENAENNLTDVEDQILDLLTTSAMVDVEAAENLTNLLKQLTLQNSTGTTDNWNYGSSVFFCTTIVTTIGYGNIAPTTTGGRGFFIFYALVGIPLALIFLALLSTILNKIIDWLLKKLSKHAEKGWVRFVTFLMIVFTGLTLFMFIPSVIFYSLQGWTYFESVYYCFVTLTTVGFGDFVPTRDPDSIQYQGLYRVCASGWIWFGLAFVALLIGRVQSLIQGLGEKCNNACHKCCESCEKGKVPVTLKKVDMKEYGGTD